METRLDRTGVDATANNIIRTARATARFFRKPRQGDLILFSQISSIRNEGRHELRRRIPADVASWVRTGTALRVFRPTAPSAS